jgi:hypothetical protein
VALLPDDPHESPESGGSSGAKKDGRGKAGVWEKTEVGGAAVDRLSVAKLKVTDRQGFEIRLCGASIPINVFEAIASRRRIGEIKVIEHATKVLARQGLRCGKGERELVG